ncbi:RNA 2'-phosphotransferase [Listeria fleischmannii 1991]|nr:RNA 2'-phosphotransferase [Listeria fleischmannii]KMT60176.1 RNA 2'-phosphotransferase [Listeria fleischmannii 1991]
MNEDNFEKLSKEVSYALRHAPREYKLELDKEGWVPVKQLISSLKEVRHWDSLTESDLREMISKSQKKRHEIVNNKIRALYGHSTPTKITKEEACPPKYLYHGTSPESYKEIMVKGLLPMNRQYVHLSEDINTANLVGSRKTDTPIILSIDTYAAREEGVKFYHGNDQVWLADSVPSKCISVVDEFNQEK